ncbi:zinc ribbon domain-containing protein [Halobellus sp. Atlit-31R]|nr:zinc ribbon domain-containing protein [Halobellus sp. Atlit-31R]
MSSQREKRPWLAALLGTLATGLGHLYLRRWRRGLGWFAATVLTSVLFVPPEAAQTLLDGGGGDPMSLAPVLAVGIASVADAYVLARRRQHRSASVDRAARSTDADDHAHGDGEASAADSAASVDATGASDTEETCPQCGKELDPDLDFCPWCTARLDGGADDD